jgi:hypothetical protein
MLTEAEGLVLIEKTRTVLAELEKPCCDDPLCGRRLIGAIMARQVSPVIKGMQVIIDPTASAEYGRLLDDCLAKIAAAHATEADKPDVVEPKT